MASSANFTVNGNATPPDIAVAASSTVNLALTSISGIRTVAWSIVSNSDPSLVNPTITPAGSPVGATASFTMPAGTGQGYRVQCVVNGGRDDEGVYQSALTKVALIGVLGTGGFVPLAVGETTERDEEYGYIPPLNAILDSGGTGSLADDSVTFAKLQNIGGGLIGNDTGTADPKLIPLGSGLAFSGGSLVATGGTGGAGGLAYAFDVSTATTSDPGSGDFRLNNAALASVTSIAVSDTDSNGGANEAYLLAQDDSTTLAHRGYITIRKVSAPGTFAVYDITGASTNSAGWVQFAVTYVASSGSFSSTDACSVSFARTGDAGTAGTNGTNGTNGAAGAQGIVGLTYLFATSTTTSSDPSAGNFRLNNATAASVTAAAFADTDSNGNASEAFLLAQDDSTTTAHRGHITIRSRTTPATFRVYDITGASTDSAGWVQFVLTHVASGGTLSASEPCDVQFSRTGDAGTATTAAGTNGQLQYNNAGAPAGASITTTGSDLTGVTALNGVKVATPTIGTTLADANVTISVAGGGVYELNVNLTANRSVGLAVTGSPRAKQGISIRKYTTAAFNLTVNDEVGNPLYVFPQAVKGIADFQYDSATSKFVLVGNMDLT